MEQTALGDEFTAPHFSASALLVVDVQNDFLDGGSCPVPGTSDRLPQIDELLGAFRRAGRPIVHVIRLYANDEVDLVRRTSLLAGAPIVRPNSTGAEIPAALLPDPAIRLDSSTLLSGALQPIGEREAIVWKPRWSAFHRTPLDDHLSALGVDTVVLAGCNFPNCPRATAFDASARDLRIVLAQDAVSQTTPDRLADAVGIGVVPMTVQAIADALPSIA